jgi:predicted dienelactone hydrolase
MLPYYFLPNFIILSWGDTPEDPVTPMPLRTEQLKMRHIEILEAFKAFKHLIIGDNNIFSSERHYSDWESWRGRVNTRTMTFAGHSFGGCTTVSQMP